MVLKEERVESGLEEWAGEDVVDVVVLVGAAKGAGGRGFAKSPVGGPLVE